MQMTTFERALGYQFKNKKLLKAALIHPSYSLENSKNLGLENFQRLEFLGDAILNLFIARNLYQRFPKANEGLLSRLRSTLVSRKLLARVAKPLHLKKHIYMSAHHRIDSSIEIELNLEKMIADTFEALIAALYFDRGQKITEAFLAKRFRSYFNEKKLFQLDPNPKSTLQEYVQKKFGILPVYEASLDKKTRQFTTFVTVKRGMKAKGTGRTKQEAEVEAAQALLKKLSPCPVRNLKHQKK